MKKTFKKLTRYFKTDTELFIEELNDNRRQIDYTIKTLEKNIQILESALAKHIALGHYLDEKKTSKHLRIESIDKIVIQYVKMRKDTTAKEMIREKMKEQQKLQGLYETIELHNQRIQDYQYRLKKAIYTLDNQNINKEAFIIKQQIAIQELRILEKLDKGNGRTHIERVQREILDIDTYKLLDLKEDVLNSAQIDEEIEKELSFFKMNYSSHNW